jgi:hypothetical protein
MSFDLAPFNKWATENRIPAPKADNPNWKPPEEIVGPRADPSPEPQSLFKVVGTHDIISKPFIRGVSNGRTLSEFAFDLGQVLKRENLFVRQSKCVRFEFDAESGVERLIEIDAQQFRSIVEQYCHIGILKVRDDQPGKPIITVNRSISIDTSRAVLVSDQFLGCLRPIFALNTVRLPILRSIGSIELLPEGYDTESCTFTKVVKDFVFDENWEVAKAKDYLESLLSEFCFRENDKARAKSVVIAQMLTLFCSNLVVKVARPAFIYTANAEGAGKTLLAKLGIIARLGYCPTGAAPAEEKEMKKLIFSTAISGLPIFFLDNVKGYLKSPSLEALITSLMVSDRVLGESKTREIPNIMTTVITGNALTISPDMRRRSLVVELFLETARAEDRVINNPLDDERLKERRGEILSALWALVREWSHSGKPEPKETHNTFLGWSKTIGGILEHAGFASPCTIPELKDSGDRDDRDMQSLVESMNPGHEFKFVELLEFACEQGLFEALIPGDDDPAAASKRVKISNLFRKYDRRIFLGGERFCVTGTSQKTRRYSVEQTAQG